MSGSKAPPGQLAPPSKPGMATVPRSLGGVYIGPYWREVRMRSASARTSGVKSITSSSCMPWRSNGGGRVGKGWVGEVCSPGMPVWGTCRSSIGQTGSPVSRSKT